MVTAFCINLFWKYGFSIFFSLFWLKAATLGLTYVYINSYKNKEYYYYQNLGVSRLLLWGTTLTFDFSMFIFIIIQAFHLK